MLPEKTNMAHDAIPHYLRAGNCNNSANTNKDEDGTPTSQVNSKSRPIRSISSGNLAKKMSSKALKVYNNLGRDLALTLARPQKTTRSRLMMAIQACLKILNLHQILMKL